ncbi:hypothetical protein FHG87_016874 [Trinorchestia longiramus]|nr:hypothetical protein FHG87_016874 [Trinorchestia longiramus]
MSLLFCFRFQGELLNCCHNGKVCLSSLHECPLLLRRLLECDNHEARNYRDNIKNYNAAFSFASFDADVIMPPGRELYCFRLPGQTYHFISGLHPNNDERRKYGQCNEDFKSEEVLVMAGNPVACGGSVFCTRTVGPTPSSLSRCRTACCLWYPRTKPIRPNLACTSQASLLPPATSFSESLPRRHSSRWYFCVFLHLLCSFGVFVGIVFWDLHNECEQSGAQMVLFPSVQRDLVTTQSHGEFYYNLQRENEDAVTFTTSDGTPVNSSLLNMSPEPGKTNIAPQCIATDYSGAFRMGNTWDLQGAIALCQYKQN